MAVTFCIIPCFNTNTGSQCENVIEGCLKYCQKVILIDDGSTDGTSQVLQKYKDLHPDQIDLVSFESNRGKGYALLEGMKHALQQTFDALITIDGDEQHNPSEIPLIANEVMKGNELVIGSRSFQKMPFRSKFSNMFISKLLRLLYKNAPIDTQSGFRGFSHKFTKKVLETVKGGRYETEFQILLCALQSKVPIGNVPIETIYPEKVKTYFRKISDSIRILITFYFHWRKK